MVQLRLKTFAKVNFLTNHRGAENTQRRKKCLSELYCFLIRFAIACCGRIRHYSLKDKVAAPIKLEWSFFRLIVKTRTRWQLGGMLELWKKAIALTTAFKRMRTASRREGRKNRICHKVKTQLNGTLKGTIKCVF
jgi:hypothetical protein